MMKRDATTAATGPAARVAVASARQALLAGLFILLIL